MKIFAAVALAVFPITPVIAQSPSPAISAIKQQLDPVAIDLAPQLLEIIAPPTARQNKLAERFKFIAEQARASYATQTSAGDPKFSALVDKSMDEMWQQMVVVMGRHIPAYYNAMARAYARKFSVSELHEILTFARAPAGLKFLQNGNLIVQDADVVAVQQQMMVDMTDGLPELRKKTDASIADYIAHKLKSKAN